MIDKEDWICRKAIELAEKQTGLSFCLLSPLMQMKIWEEAEVAYNLAEFTSIDKIWDRWKDSQLIEPEMQVDK